MTEKGRIRKRSKREARIVKTAGILVLFIHIFMFLLAYMEGEKGFVYALTREPGKVFSGAVLVQGPGLEALGEEGGTETGSEAGTEAGPETGTEAGTEAEMEIKTETDTNGEILHFTRKMDSDQAEAPKLPEESYWDRNGNEYVLDHYEVKEIPGHMVSRSLEKQVVYTAVEGVEGLPESIPVEEEVSGASAEGELYIRDSRVVREAWQDGFQAPVLFHSYGADEYQTGSLRVSGDDVLASALDAREGLLEVMGLSPEEYRIDFLEWDGEAFMDEEGQMCRQAVARGQKLVRDFEITYEGEVEYMEPASYEMEIMYRPVHPSTVWVSDEEPVTPAPAAVQVPSTVGEHGPLWYWVRSGFVITVGIGIIGICVGITVLAAVWFRQKRKERRQRYLPHKITG